MYNDPLGIISAEQWNLLEDYAKNGVGDTELFEGAPVGMTYREDGTGTIIFYENGQLVTHNVVGEEFFKTDHSGYTDENGVYWGTVHFAWETEVITAGRRSKSIASWRRLRLFLIQSD